MALAQMTMTSPDFSRFVERCYDPSAPFDAWVAGLPAVIAPIVASREGIVVSGGEVPHAPSAASACGRAERMLPSLAPCHLKAPPGLMERAYRPFLVTKLTRQFGLRSMLEQPFCRQLFGPLGFVDAIGLMARDGPAAAVVSIPLAAGDVRSDREPHLYRIRRHVQSGFMGVIRRVPAMDDVVADASGRLLHPGLERLGSAERELLKAAARAHDRERRGALPDADADRVWGELWNGGWAVVETVDSDGRRMLLLRRDPSNPRAGALVAREQRALELVARGASYKSVAFELAVAVSTASGIVTRALRKLGFRSRVDFLRHIGEQTSRSSG